MILFWLVIFDLDVELKSRILQIVVDSKESIAEIYTYDEQLLTTLTLGEGRQRFEVAKDEPPPPSQDAIAIQLMGNLIKRKEQAYEDLRRQMEQEKEDAKRQMGQMEQEKEDAKRQMGQIEQEKEDIKRQIRQMEQEKEDIKRQMEQMRSNTTHLMDA